ncbi:MAG: segregation/condensation protein A [Promethearchaeota archaeon]
MTESSVEPFWLHQPWRVLTDILDLQKISPWEIDLAELVNGFIGHLLATEIMDFRICGRALLSAAILLRIKTEYLLEFGREEEEALEALTEDIFLPPIRPPFRLQTRPTSSAELFEALRELVYPPMKRHRKRRKALPIPDVLAPLDASHVELNKTIKLIFDRLCQEIGAKNPISFHDFIKGMSKAEIIRVFLSILFLLSEKKVLIEQDKQFGDITIKVVDDGRRGAPNA